MIFRIILRRNQKRKLEVDLARAAVGNAARGRYDAALSRYKIFLSYFGFIFQITNLLRLDEHAASYVQSLYENSLPMVWAADFLSGLSDKWPHLRGHLSGAWRNFTAWKRLEPAQQAKPASRIVVRWWFYVLLVGLTEANFHVVFPFMAHLALVWALCRPAEVRALFWKDIEILPDGRAVVCIDYSKTSVRKFTSESVVISDPFISKVLELAKSCSTDDDLVWPFRVDTFGKMFNAFQAETHTKGYTPYSLKRGGASSHYLYFKSFEKLCVDGRWNSVKAARIYIDSAVASLVRQSIPLEVLNRQRATSRWLKRWAASVGVDGVSFLLET